MADRRLFKEKIKSWIFCTRKVTGMPITEEEEKIAEVVVEAGYITYKAHLTVDGESVAEKTGLFLPEVHLVGGQVEAVIELAPNKVISCCFYPHGPRLIR